MSSIKGNLHVNHSLQDLVSMDKKRIPSSPKFNMKEKDSVKHGVKSFDLNKIPFEEGELHPDPEIHHLILSMLKVMYPEFF
ncbi:hypothetical protein FRX31_026432 [Thalictrum thalictroides]|uniref:Uncharacterized protein n=1 Tax=Thalictrum thalictroides TaxID=46969 RepID=A0A7J6VGX7_THATH|nr:hypothetical protein FRX31_026432 [Thalictrum thalictroides]